MNGNIAGKGENAAESKESTHLLVFTRPTKKIVVLRVTRPYLENCRRP